MTHQSVLDTAGAFTADRDPLQRASDWRRLGTYQVQSYGPGGLQNRTWTLSWPVASRATSQLVRHHWEANARGTFDVTIPGEGVVHCEYRTPPRITRARHRSYAITLSVRESFARST